MNFYIFLNISLAILITFVFPIGITKATVLSAKPTALSISPSEVEVGWQVPEGGAASIFRVYRNGDLAGETSRTTFNDRGLASGTSYVYVVRTVDRSGKESEPSPYVIVKTQSGIPGDQIPPQAPVWQTAVAVSATAAQLSWEPAKDNVLVAGYRVFRNEVLATTTPTTSFRDNDLTPSIAYSYRLVAFDLAGNQSVSSETRNVTTLNSTLSQDNFPPTQPSGLTAKVVGPGQVDISWQKSSDNVGVTAYRVYRDKIMLATIPDTGYADFSVEPSTTYVYTVAAYDGAGNISIESSPASITTLSSEGVRPNSPAELSATYEGRQVLLRWKDSSNNETSFLIERRRVGDPAWSRVSSVGANNTSFSDTGALAGTHEYRVSACAAECSASIASAPIKVGSAPDAAVTAPSTVPGVAVPNPVFISQTLSQGKRGPEVETLQRILIGQGLLPEDSASGYFGPATRQAVIAFQNKYAAEILAPAGLKEGNGIVGELTRKKLNVYLAPQAATPLTSGTVSISSPSTASKTLTTPIATLASISFTSTLRQGMRGPEVLALQVVLVKEGFLDPASPSAYFGEQTLKGVKAFQKKYQEEILLPAELSEPNGIVGELTRKKLNSLVRS